MFVRRGGNGQSVQVGDAKVSRGARYQSERCARFLPMGQYLAGGCVCVCMIVLYAYVCFCGCVCVVVRM